MTITQEHTGTEHAAALTSLWLEITGKCQLRCGSCYAGSGPDGTHGTMKPEDWERVLQEAAVLGASRVTVIGGEPALNPDLPRIVRHALDLRLHVEVYTNLVAVTPDLWDVFELPGVSLATSWYSNDRLEHKAITGRDTFRQTLGNIEEAVRRGIPLRAGVVDGILPGQYAKEGEELLRGQGVTKIGTDRVREFGRGTIPDPTQACGRCGHGRAAVLPDGSVTPCPMTRWMQAGSVHDAELGTILEQVTEMAGTLPEPRRDVNACNPDSDGGDCSPAETDACGPSYCNPDG